MADVCKSVYKSKTQVLYGTSHSRIIATLLATITAEVITSRMVLSNTFSFSNADKFESSIALFVI